MDIQFDEIVQYMGKPAAIGVIPADTIYGVMARVEDRAAVERLYRLKHRERKPGSVIAASIEQLVRIGVKRRYLTAVEHFWPGPVSIVIPCGPELAYLHQGVGSIVMRVPRNETVHTLLMHTGPLLTSSVNHPGAPQANTILEAKAYFGDQVDFYVDGGDLSGRKPSTILRIVDDAIEILREGSGADRREGKCEMTFDEYQKQALTTAVNTYEPLMEKTIWAMGVAGEAGEVVEKWKKIVAYKNGAVSDDDVNELAKELGDVVWYIAVLAHSLGLGFDDVMQRNVEKLKSRQSRDVIKGAGDNR